MSEPSPRAAALLVAARGAAMVAFVAGCEPAVAALAWPSLAALRGTGPLTFSIALQALCGSVLALAWAWLLLAVTLTAVAALTRTARLPRLGTLTERLAGRTVPCGVRRLLLTACGVALSTSAAVLPATAATTSAPDATGPSAAAVAPGLTGLPLPDRVTSRHRAWVTVRPGDSLWTIAGRLLPAAADDRDIASAWHRLAAANRAVLKGRPDLIHPGTRLRVPAVLYRRGDR